MHENRMNSVRLNLVVQGAHCAYCNHAFVGPDIVFYDGVAFCKTCSDSLDLIDVEEIASLVTCACCSGQWSTVRGLYFWTPRTFHAFHDTPKLFHATHDHDLLLCKPYPKHDEPDL